ncbi:MAG: hypothetical protein ABIV13_07440 [Fimbriimonadales bacterium]
MLLLLPLLPLLAGAPQIEPAITQDDWTVLGEVQVFGQTDPDGRKEPARTIQLKFPKNTAQPVDFDGPGFDYKGGKVLINEWGNLGRLHWAADGWAEVRALREKAMQNITAGNSVPWKVRAYIMTRTDLLRKDKNGVWLIEDDTMLDEDITLILESFVRMEALVEAFSGGAVDVQIDYALESATIHREYENVAMTWVPEVAAREFYEARFNTGDYDSVMAVYSLAESDTADAGWTRGKTNGAVGSTVLYSNGRERDNNLWHTQQLVSEFLEGVRISAYDWGYGNAEYATLIPPVAAGPENGYAPSSSEYPGMFAWLNDYAREFIGEALWKKVRNRTTPDFSTAYGLMKSYDGQLKRWSETASDPWSSLPLVTAADIAARIGATSLKIMDREASVMLSPEGGEYRTPMKVSPDTSDAVLNNQLNPAREAIARIGYADRDLLLIRWDVADFVINRLGDHPSGSAPPANVMGILKVGERPFVVVDTKLSNDTLIETNLLGNGVAVHTRGLIEVGDVVPVRFVSDTADARFTVTGIDGTGMTVSNGELQVSTQTPGVRVYKAIAALPSGQREERPFVIRVVEPVTINDFRYTHGNLSASFTNNGPARAVTTEVQLPAGWSTSQGLPNSMGAYETLSMAINPVYPSGRLGISGATLSVTPAGRTGVTARTALQDSTGADLVHNTFEGGTEGWGIRRYDSGNYSAEAVQDAERGNVLAVRDGGGSRFGKVTAFGRVLEDGLADPNFGGYSVEDFPYVNFMLKSDGKAPLALSLMVNGRPFLIPITGEPQVNRNNSPWLDRVKFTPDGTWQQICYNLAAALPGSEGRRFVTGITFGDPRRFAENQYRSDRVSTHFVDDFKISTAPAANATTSDVDAELEPVGDLTSTDPYLRALGAVSATGTPQELQLLRGLLSDQDIVVRTNVAMAFARLKDAESVPALIAAALLERIPYPAVMTVRALAFQDSPETWKAMGTIIRQGRGEELSTAQAAILMGASKRPEFIDDISVMLTAKLWQARQAGVSALGQIGTEPAYLMMLTFLLEVDPMVRMRVARSSNPDVELVARRLEWSSINDLSNVVKGHSYAALTRADDPLRRSRGYAGLKEEDPVIRRIIAEQMSLRSIESHVTPLLGLLSDPVPEVRGAAVEALLLMPGTRSFSEISVLAGENDDAVIYRLLDAARQRTIELPRSMLERLASHRNPLIRDRVKDLIR